MKKKRKKKENSKLLLNSNKHPISLRQCDHEYVFYLNININSSFFMILKPGPRIRSSRFEKWSTRGGRRISRQSRSPRVDPWTWFSTSAMFYNAAWWVHWHSLKKKLQKKRRKKLSPMLSCLWWVREVKEVWRLLTVIFSIWVSKIQVIEFLKIDQKYNFHLQRKSICKTRKSHLNFRTYFECPSYFKHF